MSELAQYLVLNKKPYFRIADEFIKLNQLFKSETTFEKLNFWGDMVIHPLLNIVSILFFKQEMGIFTILMIYKTLSKWQNYFRYLDLKRDFSEWKQVVRSVGGPFISTNDDTYQAYVYADGMQRLHDSLFRRLPISFPEKGSKRLE
jgi:hypothetical protein